MLASGALLLFAGLFAADYLARNAEPLLRQRLTDTLATRFHAPVTLDALHLSLLRGLEIEGTGLHVGYPAGTAPAGSMNSMIAVASFRFRTNLSTLLREGLRHQPLHVDSLRVDGLELHIPATGRLLPSPDDRASGAEEEAVLLGRIDCRDVKLNLDPAPRTREPAPSAPGTTPGSLRVFSLHTLTLTHVGPHQPMLYEAQLVIPKLTANLHVVGHFGPWQGARSPDLPTADRRPQPGDTPIDGAYTLDHANLGAIRGIAGTLTSAGRFAGVLGSMEVDGYTDTPDFSLSTARHPLPLHTDFHAVVDGTTGDTALQPVRAWLGGSVFTARGNIVRVRDAGHDIQLGIDVPHGHIEDFLRLAVRTSPPVLDGPLTLHATLHIPSGNEPVPQKLSLAGTFRIAPVRLGNVNWQRKLDGLSARATGHPELATAMGANPARAGDPSQLAANVALDRGVLSITDLRYNLPGVLVLLNGVYSADGRLFEFKGHVRTEATASQMIGGWKGLLLSPLDHYLQKNGAGVELPLEISGTGGQLHFGLAFAGAEDSPAALLRDLHQQQNDRKQLGEARQSDAAAEAEDRAAAQAPTLAEAERHHNNAVRLRAEARQRALAAGKTLPGR